MLLCSFGKISRLLKLGLTLLTVAIVANAANSSAAGDTCKRDADGLCASEREFINQLNSRRNWRIDREVNGKIYLGKPADAGKFPWMAAVGVAESTHSGYVCGGTLIAKQWIMTAAHCFVSSVSSLKNTQLSALINEVDIRQGFTGSKASWIAEVYLPKGFMDECGGKDVALLKLRDEFEIEAGKLATPITAQKFADIGHDNEESGSELINYSILGFGATENSSSTSILNAAQVRSLSTGRCRLEKIYGDSIRDDMICAGSLTDIERSDACNADSGGGLVLQTTVGDQEQNLVAGIVSWGGAPIDGKACSARQSCTTDPFRVGVYTRVSSYESYITDCINGNDACLEFFELWAKH